MNANFRLPSLHLGTEFDGPIVPLDVPGRLGKGTDSALYILDGANRAPHRLSRMVRPVGLLGIKLADPGSGVRITMRLLVDDISTQMWDRYMFRLKGTPMPQEEEYVPSDVSTRHRLVEVTAQGRSRGLAMLALRRHDDGVVRQHLSFELPAEEIGESGLVMIGLEGPTRAPAWSTQDELDEGLVGVCVARMWVDPIEPLAQPYISTGRPSAGPRKTATGTDPGFFVLNPIADDSALEVTLRPERSAGERLVGRRAKVTHPLRYARERVEDLRVATTGSAEVEVVDLQGRVVLSSTLHDDYGTYRFTVPADIGPAFVRACMVLAGRAQPTSWEVRVCRTEG